MNRLQQIKKAVQRVQHNTNNKLVLDVDNIIKNEYCKTSNKTDKPKTLNFN